MSKKFIVRLVREAVRASLHSDVCLRGGLLLARRPKVVVLFNTSGRRFIQKLMERAAAATGMESSGGEHFAVAAIRPEFVGYIIAPPRRTDGWMDGKAARRLIGRETEYVTGERVFFRRYISRGRVWGVDEQSLPGGQLSLVGWLQLVADYRHPLHKWMLVDEPEGLVVVPVSPDGTETFGATPVTESSVEPFDFEALFSSASKSSAMSEFSEQAENSDIADTEGQESAERDLDADLAETEVQEESAEMDLDADLAETEVQEESAEMDRDDADSDDSSPECSSGEERPKGTDEVRPTGAQSEDSSYHGGDGSSGEIDGSPGSRPSSTDSQSSQTSAGTGSEGGDEASRTPARDPRPKEGKRPRSTGAQGESPDANPTVQGRDLLQGGTPLLSDKAGQPADAWDSDEALTPEEKIELRELAGVHASSPESRTPKGGTVQHFEKTELDRYRLLVRQMPETRKVRYLLSQLVRKQIGAGGSSLRVDGKRLVTEIVSRRYNMSRIHKRDRMPGVAFLFVDTSGSMPGNSVGLFLGLVQLLSEKEFGECIVPVEAPNGVLGAAMVLPKTGELWSCPDELMGSAHAVALEYARRGWGEPRLLIWFTDNHAAESAVRAAKDLPEALHIYLDVFGAKDGVRWGTKTWRRQYGFPDEMVFVQGVSTPAQVAQALEMILRGK